MTMLDVIVGLHCLILCSYKRGTYHDISLSRNSQTLYDLYHAKQKTPRVQKTVRPIRSSSK